MKLYYVPGACSLAPHIILREIGATFELEKVDLATRKTAAGEDFSRISLKGAVPILDIGNGERLSEGPVICQYLADTAHRSDLLPAIGAWERYRVTEWQNYVTSELHKSFSPLFNSAFDAAAKSLFRRSLRSKYEWVDTCLRDRDYLAGNAFTVADAYLFVVTGWARQVDVDLSDLSALQGFMKRISNRPATREAIRAEGLKGAE